MALGRSNNLFVRLTVRPKRGLTLWQREALAAQLLFQRRDTSCGVASIAVFDGAQRRQICREATFATGTAGISAGQVSELGAIGGVVNLCLSWTCEHAADEATSEKSSLASALIT